MLAFWTNLGNSAALRKHFIESASSKYTVYRAYTGILVYYTEYTGIISKIYRCVTALLILHHDAWASRHVPFEYIQSTTLGCTMNMAGLMAEKHEGLKLKDRPCLTFVLHI
jgi:hypothetical protein